MRDCRKLRQMFLAEHEVVHRVNVFEQVGVGDVAHATSLSGWIEGTGASVGLLVKGIIVLRLIDPHTP
jgi:hypothetical protein